MADQNSDIFVADDEGPPRRRFWIARDPEGLRNDTVRGWAFAYNDAGPSGEFEVGLDFWEEWFFEILRYPGEYSSAALVWRRVSDGEVVDLASLQIVYDGRSISSDETAESAGLRSPSSTPT